MDSREWFYVILEMTQREYKRAIGEALLAQYIWKNNVVWRNVLLRRRSMEHLGRQVMTILLLAHDIDAMQTPRSDALGILRQAVAD